MGLTGWWGLRFCWGLGLVWGLTVVSFVNLCHGLVSVGQGLVAGGGVGYGWVVGVLAGAGGALGASHPPPNLPPGREEG